MIERRHAGHLIVSSIRFPVPAAILLLALGSAACGGGGSGGTGGGGGGGAGGSGSTSSSSTTSSASGGGQVILSCGQDLAFVASCRVEASAYTACSDFFGNQITNALSAQCAAGNGTFSTTPCALDDRAGACVFFSEALPDRCYVEHIAPPSAADFWETTCPQTGGVWTPAP